MAEPLELADEPAAVAVGVGGVAAVEEVLAELSHIPLAILAVTAGWSRWLELRLPSENQTRSVLARLWPLCIALIGVVLLNYREM